MKKAVTIAFFALTTILLITFIYIKTENKDDKQNTQIINYTDLIKSLDIIPTVNKKINIKEKLEAHGESFSQPSYIKNDIIYGDCIDISATNITLKSTSLWSYDINNENLKYYKYDGHKRIWKYAFIDNKVYYVELSEKDETDDFEWKLILSDFDFDNQIVLDSGELNDVMDAPFFVQDDINDILIFVAQYDEFEESAEQTNIYKSKFKIYSLNDEKMSLILSGDGNHQTKQGIFLRRANYCVKLFNNILMYTEVSYYDKEVTYALDLSTNKKRAIYENDDLDNWGLAEADFNSTGYFLSFKGQENNGKIVIVDNSLNVKETIISGYKIFKSIYDENFIVSNQKKYTVFSMTDNRFIGKIEIDDRDFLPYFLSNKDKIVIFQTLDGEYYKIQF